MVMHSMAGRPQKRYAQPPRGPPAVENGPKVTVPATAADTSVSFPGLTGI